MCLQTFHGVEKTPLFYYNNQHQEKRFGGSKKGIRFSKKFFETHRKPHGYWVPVISVTKDILWVQFRYPPRKPTNHHGLVGFFVSKNNLGKKDTSTIKTVIGGI